MQLYVKIIPVWAGTSQPAGDPLMAECPGDVESDTFRSFQTQKFGEPICTVWTSSDRHPRIDTGWVFAGMPATDTDPAVELLCMPYIRADDGSMQSLFELQADQRQDFEQLAAGGAFDTYTVIQQPLHEYQPATTAGGAASEPAAGHADGGSHRAANLEQLDETLTQLARETGATLIAYPRPGRAVRRILLRDIRDDEGSQFEAAQIEDDGTLRIIGHDQGPGVNKFFGEGITSYEWIYTIAPERVASLIEALGGQLDDDVLALLAAHHQHTGGQLSDLMNNPEIAAQFTNWHS